jgi:queuine tRNA-ribosyltransferase
MLGAHLATVHNLYFYLALMKEAREAISAGRYRAFQDDFARYRAAGIAN